MLINFYNKYFNSVNHYYRQQWFATILHCWAQPGASIKLALDT